MNTSTNVHGCLKIFVGEDEGDGTKWTTLKFRSRDHTSHTVTVFDTTMLDFVNALEKAMHKDKADLIKASDEGYVI